MVLKAIWPVKNSSSGLNLVKFNSRRTPKMKKYSPNIRISVFYRRIFKKPKQNGWDILPSLGSHGCISTWDENQNWTCIWIWMIPAIELNARGTKWWKWWTLETVFILNENTETNDFWRDPQNNCRDGLKTGEKTYFYEL